MAVFRSKALRDSNAPATAASCEAVASGRPSPGLESVGRFSLAATAGGISELSGGLVGMLIREGIPAVGLINGTAPNRDCERGGVGSNDIGLAGTVGSFENLLGRGNNPIPVSGTNAVGG